MEHAHGVIGHVEPAGAVKRDLLGVVRCLGTGGLESLDRWKVGLWGLLALPVVFQVAALARLLVAQLRFPMDLEWMEGGELYHAYRLLHGQPIYGPPSQGFVPYPYPPLHFALLALVSKLTGFSYASARAVSVAGFSIASGLLCREVAVHARGRIEGVALGLLAFGTIAATVPTVSGWYALIRVDAVAIAVPVLAAVLAQRKPCSPRVSYLLATTLVAAVLAKQTNFFFAVWLCLFVIRRDGRASLRVILATVVLGSVALLLLELWTHGWFGIFMLMMRHHPIIESAVPLGLWELGKSAPHLILAPFALFFLLGRRALSSRAAVWSGMLIAALPASFLPLAKNGGAPNNFIPVMLLAGPTAIVLGLDFGRCFGRSKALLVGALLASYLSLFVYSSRFDPGPFMPPASRQQRAQELNRWVASLPGEVLSFSHPMLAILNGKTTEQLHAWPIVDAIWGKLEGFDFDGFLERTRPDWILVDQDFIEGNVERAVLSKYELAGNLPVTVEMTIAAQNFPSRIYRPKPEFLHKPTPVAK